MSNILAMKNLSHTVVKLKYILEAQKRQRQFVYRELKLSWEQMAKASNSSQKSMKSHFQILESSHGIQLWI